MALLQIPLPNKPFDLIYAKPNLYYSDAMGNIFQSKYPFTTPKHFHKNKNPVSCMCYHNGIIYGTWKGEVTKLDEKGNNLNTIILGSGMIKSIYYQNSVYVSIEDSVYILNLQLEIQNQIKTDSRVLCMEYYRGKMYGGMSVPIIARIDKSYQKMDIHNMHDTSILDFCVINEDLYSGSADGTIRRFIFPHSMDIIHKGEGWVRSLTHLNGDLLFSQGRNIIYKNNVLYRHEQDVLKVIYAEEVIISIGLDYKMSIYSFGETCNSEEEKELEELLSQ
ncbi:hypothetical protein TCON_0938 [Astathelohania contejeani]|uniref:Uncharacterized protein n=1 Tax=Astathelohania contejeani TaxID=164912 RepID=A0ABQ7I0B4_9MICR|nr:hypothetical protein TCON_0938 [Thelohania contejeani]